MPNKNKPTQDYKQKLIALCEGLECREIPEMIEKMPTDEFRIMGMVIAEQAKQAPPILPTNSFLEN